MFGRGEAGAAGAAGAADAAAGSDATGDGSLARPFASPARGAAAVQQACAGPSPCAGGAALLLRGGRYVVSASGRASGRDRVYGEV